MLFTNRSILVFGACVALVGAAEAAQSAPITTPLTFPWRVEGSAFVYESSPGLGLRVGHLESGTATLSGADYEFNDASSVLVEVGNTLGILRVVDGGHLTINAPDALVLVAAGTGGGYGGLTVSGRDSRIDVTGTVAVGMTPDLTTNSPALSDLVIRDGGVLTAERILLGGDLTGGGGTIAGDVELHGGFIGPGESPGVLTIDGSVVMDAASHLYIEWGGGATELQDRLVVTGQIALAGTLEVVLLDGFEPELGDSLYFLDALTVFGQFDQLILPSLSGGRSLAFTSGPGGSFIVVQPVPVPAALPLFMGGVLTLATRRRSVERSARK